MDAHLEQDSRAKVACETFAKTGMIMVGGEISSKANVNYQKVIRDTIKVTRNKSNYFLFVISFRRINTHQLLCANIKSYFSVQKFK